MTNPKVVKELRRIQQLNRQHLLLPADVVAEAKSRASPLHKFFTWDDRKAAHDFRLWQARQLISSVEIVTDDRHETGPAFVSLNVDRKASGGYRSTKSVVSDAELSAALLATATAELRSFQQRYRRLAALAGVFKEIEKVARATTRKRSKAA